MTRYLSLTVLSRFFIAEYHHKFISKRVKNPYTGCYLLAVSIFCLGLVRDAWYVIRSLEPSPEPSISV